MNIGIIDYGASNLHSVGNGLDALGKTFTVITRPEELVGVDKVILPGVGAAGSAMEKLKKSGFADVLPTLKIPVLGVCLGLQLMTEFSEEDEVECLSLLPGRVKRFRTELKVPHMGWNTVNLVKKSPLTEGVPEGAYFYFVHSYYLETEAQYVLGKTSYDADFPAIVQKGNFYGTQFHPEKSGQWGMKILDNFCELC